MARSLSRPSTIFSTAATCLGTFFAVVNVGFFTFLSTCITDIGAQITEPLCKSAVHRHQCCRCPTNSRALSIDLGTACHHFDILFFEVRSGTELARFSAFHAGIYAALQFCVLKGSCSRRRHLNMLMVIIQFIINQPF